MKTFFKLKTNQKIGAILPSLFLGATDEEREYFFSLARKFGKELLLHEAEGLWEKDEEGKNWVNVTEHCLREAARVDMLARLLGLSENVREQLISAAVLHDFNKKNEARLVKEDILNKGTGRKGLKIAEDKAEKTLRAAGFSETVISLASHVTPYAEDALFIKNILDSSSLSQLDIAHLIMHYVDSYTRGSLWAEPAKRQKGKIVNDVDRRSAMNASNSAYEKMNREGLTLNEKYPFFKGMTPFESMAVINHLIEKKLAGIIRERGVDVGEPVHLPEFVDARIRENILKASRFVI